MTTGMTATDRVDIHEHVVAICRALGWDENYVGKIEITPTEATATIFRGRDGLFTGTKYVDQKTGEPATETLKARVRA